MGLAAIAARIRSETPRLPGESGEAWWYRTMGLALDEAVWALPPREERPRPVVERRAPYRCAKFYYDEILARYKKPC